MCCSLSLDGTCLLISGAVLITAGISQGGNIVTGKNTRLLCTIIDAFEPAVLATFGYQVKSYLTQLPIKMLEKQLKSAQNSHPFFNSSSSDFCGLYG